MSTSTSGDRSGVGSESGRGIKTGWGAARGVGITVVALLALTGCATPGAGQDTEQPQQTVTVTVSFGEDVTVTAAPRDSNAPAAQQTAEATSEATADVKVPTPITPE